MERKIEMYSEITGGVKRTHVDLVGAGVVRDRETSEGYTHAGVDEYARRNANEMAEAYGIPQSDIIDHGVLTYAEFTKMARR